MTDPYRILGVSPAASQAEIAHAYRSQLRNYHPDSRVGGTSSTSDERLQQIIAAYRWLRDPRRQDDGDSVAAQVRDLDTATRIAVTLIDPAADGPVLWAGPVFWQR
ncbi:J domain-containing protein [Mycobacterium decipiens]|uniref:J domain-containing protein n=1 Tax=Mycobacterium decipiens TaxID=1430326 RepID=A0A1X2M0S7_9MYCO|nr:J domain-containing protein [Mycobacterium decipiens]OSC43152.1 hypothetical protein B8W66_01800 [Mycobacterium decipiens]